MNIETVAGIGADAGQAGNISHKEVPAQLESIFLSFLLKEGLKPMIEGEDSGNSGHAGPMLETAIEQIAMDIGRTEPLGLANLLNGEKAENGNNPTKR